jgi:hypothetical protein
MDKKGSFSGCKLSCQFLISSKKNWHWKGSSSNIGWGRDPRRDFVSTISSMVMDRKFF